MLANDPLQRTLHSLGEFVWWPTRRAAPGQVRSHNKRTATEPRDLRVNTDPHQRKLESLRQFWRPSKCPQQEEEEEDDDDTKTEAGTPPLCSPKCVLSFFDE